MTLDERIDGFITSLPRSFNDHVYIVLYNTDFYDDFRTRVSELRPDLSEWLVLLDKNEYGQFKWEKPTMFYIFDYTYNYIGNGYN